MTGRQAKKRDVTAHADDRDQICRLKSVSDVEPEMSLLIGEWDSLTRVLRMRGFLRCSSKLQVLFT
jgi:hypothetical protein